MANKETIFIDGMFVKTPNPKAPEFVRLHLSVKVDEFIEFANRHKNEKGYINIDVLKSKKGKLYLSLNDYKKETGFDDDLEQADQEREGEEIGGHVEEINSKDLPF